ncbi:hypothetical protein C266_11895 [Pandoraea sp. SD6-2]|nr:hypothetical protein C266_11895 [Pandoraea sp. SD6-2]
MRLDDFGHCFESIQAMFDLGMRGPDPDDGCNPTADETGIDPCRVTFDYPLLLELLYTGSDGGLRKSDLLAKFGVADTRIALKSL